MSFVLTLCMIRFNSECTEGVNGNYKWDLPIHLLNKYYQMLSYNNLLIHISYKRSCKGSCQSGPKVIADCYYGYSSKDEDTTLLSLPGWKPIPQNTSWPKSLLMCPKP